MKKMRNRSKIRKQNNKQKIPGDHIIRFFRDAKSGHPYMSISKEGNKYYGHDMTSHPSLKDDGALRKKYQKFHRNPNPDDNKNSFYHRRIKKIINTKNTYGYRLRLHPKWKISTRDLKILRNLDKRKIKNVRRDDN